MKYKLPALIIAAASLVAVQVIFAANLQSSVTVGNAAPTASSVVLNGGSPITLTANATTSINVTAIWSDNNGCSDITGGTTSILLYRTGVGAASCLSGGTNNLNCYKLTAWTSSSTCVGAQTSINATATFPVYYFAQATDASSSFPSDSWTATVNVTDPSGATSTANSATTTLISLTAINVTTSSIQYPTLAASSTSGATNPTTTVTNAGNTSTTLQLAGTAFVSGSNNFATSSQHYATSSFTYGGAEQALSSVAASVFTLTSPTSTTNISGTVFWGVGIPAGTLTGTYTATTTFSSIFHS